VKRVEEKKSVHRTREGVRGRSTVHAVSESVNAGDSGAKIGKKVMMIYIRMNVSSKQHVYKKTAAHPECLFAKEVWMS
jgi:nicotinamide mononucleotide (NMN) deamidase PncC